MPDREKVIKGCENWVNNHKDEDLLLSYSSVVELLALLKEQETDIGNLNETVKNLLNAYTEIKAIYGDSVRVVGELVRCKDCKHYHKGFNCDLLQKPILKCDDWFCADGERQEGR